MQALVILGLCQICAIGWILHDTQGVEAIARYGLAPDVLAPWLA